MNVAYIRVSSVDQNEARQVEAMEKYGIEKWFIEKISGKDTNRPELKKMLEFAREGDTCVFRNIRTANPETSGHETGSIRTLCRLN